ncbi:hypothetical protein [Acidovorax sp. NCPPB 4044]|uniref:hypothetical protein n=1 Tax=Acidovorax sp. NCPPB 4044 TaxID=2940490 RepID=UPI0023021384|nr:hypothetical protein [Acidovorax sp. NCPPB 4044]MDA8523069.1 hypothetical protein [Acidovorax sp. NCPPB 4044]
MRGGKARPGQRAGGSSWRRVRTPGRALQESLQSRYRLRVHGWCIGAFMMAFMWAVSHTQMVLGVDSLAVRYLVTLGAGYAAYLVVLRLWAARLVQLPERRARDRDEDGADGPGAGDALDAAELIHDAGDLAARALRGAGGRTPPLPRAGGGDFAGAGADGHFGDAVGGSLGDSLGDMAGGALGAAADADEGAVVVVPVVAIFLIGAAVLFGAGALALLYFGFDVLLAVAVELAFSYATARAAMGVERAGWLTAAVRLTWKPLLGALLCAIVLGAAIDRFLPDAGSLPAAVRMLTRGGH